jgi:hypothetical protein
MDESIVRTPVADGTTKANCTPYIPTGQTLTILAYGAGEAAWHLLPFLTIMISLPDGNRGGNKVHASHKQGIPSLWQTC